jgi:hypothetical protein
MEKELGVTGAPPFALKGHKISAQGNALGIDGMGIY